MSRTIFGRFLIILIAFILLFIITDGIPTPIIVPSLWVFAFVAIALVLTVFGVIKCYTHLNWKKVATEGILALVAAILIFIPLRNFQNIQKISAYVTLMFVYPKISERISWWPKNMEPQLVVVETGGVFAFGRGIAYDNSKEIEKPPGMQTATWLARAEHIGGKCWEASHLLGNYYRWSAYYGCE